MSPTPDPALIAYQVGELRAALDKHAAESKASFKELGEKIDGLKSTQQDHESRLKLGERVGKWAIGVVTVAITGLVARALGH